MHGEYSLQTEHTDLARGSPIFLPYETSQKPRRHYTSVAIIVSVYRASNQDFKSGFAYIKIAGWSGTLPPETIEL